MYLKMFISIIYIQIDKAFTRINKTKIRIENIFQTYKIKGFLIN